MKLRVGEAEVPVCSDDDAGRKLQSGQVTHTVLTSCATPLLMLRGMPAPRKDSLEVGIVLDGSKYGVATVRYFVEKRDLP